MSSTLLILTQYFPPEVGAPQNRLFELAVRLQRQGLKVTVLTAMPNYPSMAIQAAYKGKKYFFEEMDGIQVHRSSIYVSKSKSIVARLRNYFSFVVSSMRTSSKLKARYDFLLCESPPLFLGYSALYLARKKKAKLIFNVSDLWPESAEKLGVVTNKYLLKLAYNLEKKLYLKSTLVTGQTKGICNDIATRFPDVPTYWLPNGVDLSYYNPAQINAGAWRKSHDFDENDFIILYAGIIGIAQGLEIILAVAQELRSVTHLRFVLMGSGPVKPELIQKSSEMKLTNVSFLEPVGKKEMPGILKSVNAAVIPLRKLDLFLGAIPSKIFESLAMELPVLLGVDGEAREIFITEGKCGIYFEPENVTSLVAGIHQLIQNPQLASDLGKSGRQCVATNFNREKIAANFFEKLSSL